MTVGELKEIIDSIPNRENDRNISFAGDLLKEHNGVIDKAEVSWIDCSDAMLILLNEVN